MIAIIAAMELECDALKEVMCDVEEVEIQRLHFSKGNLGGKEIVLMQSGVGKGNAAMATTILLEHFNVAHVINIGTAGGLIQDENVLDIVISSRVVQHDFDSSILDGEAGRGIYFDADPYLVELTKKALCDDDYQVFIGMVASGDQFVSEDVQIDHILKYFPDSICAEMEAGAIAQVCTHYEIPFVIIRSLSDIAHKEASHMDFLTYAKKASKRSAQFTKAIVSDIAV